MKKWLFCLMLTSAVAAFATLPEQGEEEEQLPTQEVTIPEQELITP